MIFLWRKELWKIWPVTIVPLISVRLRNLSMNTIKLLQILTGVPLPPPFSLTGDQPIGIGVLGGQRCGGSCRSATVLFLLEAIGKGASSHHVPFLWKLFRWMHGPHALIWPKRTAIGNQLKSPGAARYVVINQNIFTREMWECLFGSGHTPDASKNRGVFFWSSDRCGRVKIPGQILVLLVADWDRILLVAVFRLLGVRGL